MSNLSAFFAGNAVKDEIVRYPASKRFLDEKGNPLNWELHCITSEEDEKIRKDCTRNVPVPGKQGVFVPQTDWDKYANILATKCISFPDLNNAELQDSYGVMGAGAVLQVMIKPGEYQELLKKVQEINGFNVSMDELVDSAKN